MRFVLEIAVPTLPGLAVISDLLYWYASVQLRWEPCCLSLSNLRICQCPRESHNPDYRPRAMSSVPYPSVPTQASYTFCYCEENIYLLASSFLAIPDFRNAWDLSVVFVSNRTKTASGPFPPTHPHPTPVRETLLAGGAGFYSPDPPHG